MITKRYQVYAPHILFFVIILGGCLQAASADDKSGDIKDGVNWAIKSKFSYDSNVYRSPGDTSYIDYGDSCDETNGDPNCITLDPNDPTVGVTEVFPSVYDGLFLQINIKSSFRKKTSDNNAFEARLKVDSTTYTDTVISNADKSKYSVELGDEVTLSKRKSKKNTLYMGFASGHVSALYLDRDTGDEQRFSGEDISERYTYDYRSVSLKIKLRTTKYKYDFQFKFKDSDYVNISGATEMEYDNVYTLLAAKVKIPFKRKIKLSLAFDYYNYLYNNPQNYRKSRDKDGILRKSLEPREYDYYRMKLRLRKRHSKKWLSNIEYEYTLRFDRESIEAAEYDNYEKNKIKIRLTHAYRSDLKIKYSMSVWKRIYPNAFAFNNNTQAQKQYDGQQVRILVNLRATKRRAYIIDFRYRNDNSTDLRYDYDRFIFGFGIEWKN